MKKSMLKLGKPLNKVEQKKIKGGFGIYCSPEECERGGGENPVDRVYVCICD